MDGDEFDAAAVKLQHFATRLIRIARSTHKDHALSSAQYSAMALLHDEPGMSVVALARREGVAHPTMSRLVAGLAKLGFVTRQADPDDRRSGRLHLTAEGHRLYREVAERRIALFKMLLAQFTPATTAEVLEVIERISPLVENNFRSS